MFSTKTFANADEMVANEDGVNIFYNYINDSTELEVTFVASGVHLYWGDVKIPELVTLWHETRKRYATLKVTSIGNLAFANCEYLTSVTIPASVTNIGDYAFNNCSSLTSFTIPASVTNIGDYAFYKCSSLTSFTIPASVTSIGEGIFRGCSSLTSVTILASVRNIGYQTFHSCSSLTSVTIPAGVTNIGGGAFWECSSLTSVTIPEGVRNIGDWAFLGCSSLTSVTIPASVTSIGDDAFSYCDSLTEFVSLIQEPFKVRYLVSDFSYENCTLYVPEGTIDKYKTTPDWVFFYRIEEGMPSDIKQPNGNNPNTTETHRYTIGGESISSLQRGINIVKMSDGTTKKVVVK